MADVHPYRAPPELPPDEPPPRIPSEERFLIALLIVIGGARVVLGSLAGKPIGGEATLALFAMILGLWWGMRGMPWWRWRLSRRSGKLHDRDDRDHASRR